MDSSIQYDFLKIGIIIVKIIYSKINQEYGYVGIECFCRKLVYNLNYKNNK